MSPGLLLLILSYKTSSDIFELEEINLEKKMPSSYNNQIGIARSVCDMTSGGVSSIPTTKAPTITYGLLAARLFGVLTLVII